MSPYHVPCVESSLQPLSVDEKQNTDTCGSHICLKSEKCRQPMSPPELQACHGALLRMVWKPHLVKGNALETRAWTHPQTHPCKSGIDFDTNTWKVKSLALGKVAFLLGILNTCFMEEEVIQELHCFIFF